jgi:hypothetical protein
MPSHTSFFHITLRACSFRREDATCIIFQNFNVNDRIVFPILYDSVQVGLIPELVLIEEGYV